MPRASRVKENTRSSCGAMRTNTWPWFTLPRKLPPTPASTVRTPGTARSCASTASITSSIAVMLVPSGAVTVISNSASSTSLGTYSCRTRP